MAAQSLLWIHVISEHEALGFVQTYLVFLNTKPGAGGCRRGLKWIMPVMLHNLLRTLRLNHCTFWERFRDCGCLTCFHLFCWITNRRLWYLKIFRSWDTSILKFYTSIIIQTYHINAALICGFQAVEQPFNFQFPILFFYCLIHYYYYLFCFVFFLFLPQLLSGGRWKLDTAISGEQILGWETFQIVICIYWGLSWLGGIINELSHVFWLEISGENCCWDR